MALDQMDYDLFQEIKNALVNSANELHTVNESHNNKTENANLT